MYAILAFAFQAVPWLFKKGSCEVSLTSILAFSLLVSQAFTSNCKRSSIISIPALPIPWAMRNPLLRRKSLLTATWLPSVMLKGYAPPILCPILGILLAAPSVPLLLLPLAKALTTALSNSVLLLSLIELYGVH